MGSGCHADRDVALLRAITEAAQSRLTRISGAREDFGDEAYPADPAPGNDDDPRFPAVPRRVFEAVPSFAGDTLRADPRAHRRSGHGGGIRTRSRSPT